MNEDQNNNIKNRDEISDRKKYILPSLILHALGDTIGFKNSDWEFNFKEDVTLDFVNEMIYEFINLGGVNSIDLSDWRISDDTIFQYYVGKSMLKYNGILDDNFIYRFKRNLFTALAGTVEDSKQGKNRFVGNTTKSSISRFKSTDARYEKYNMKAGGNGCAMRNLVIGICLYQESDINNLIDVSITTSKLSHNNAFGYLAGFTSAYFTSLAIRKVNPLEWPYRLLTHLKSDKMVKFIKETISQETRDYMDFIMYWEKHLDNRFDKNRELLDIKAFSNPMYRIKYYYDNFFVGTGAKMIGDAGYLATIMAYDSFVDSGGIWEKLILYGMLHPGDSDTVGAIAAGFYGAYYGFGDVPPKMYSKIEMKDKIENLSKSIEKRYY